MLLLYEFHNNGMNWRSRKLLTFGRCFCDYKKTSLDFVIFENLIDTFASNTLSESENNILMVQYLQIKMNYFTPVILYMQWTVHTIYNTKRNLQHSIVTHKHGGVGGVFLFICYVNQEGGRTIGIHTPCPLSTFGRFSLGK